MEYYKQRTLLGVEYCTDTLDYEHKGSTQDRVSVMAMMPGGHSARVTVSERTGHAYHNFWTSGKNVYMPGTVEERDDNVYFVPRHQKHHWMLYNWDRTRAPSQHMPEVRTVHIPRAVQAERA